MLIGAAALTLAACGDSDTDPPGGTARASELTQCLKKADLNTEMIDNKEGSSRAFSVTKGTGKKVAAYAYIFENPERAKGSQTTLFKFHKDSDKATVGAYTAGDTVVVSTWAAAKAQPTLNDCFEQPS